MTSIRSFSDILLNNRDLDEAEKIRFLNIIQKESLRLTDLLDGILDVSQMESGKAAWNAAPFDPEQAVSQAIESCEALARTAGVALKRAQRARRAMVVGDRDRLAQVFINLISNAIKYNTDPRPAVTISSSLRKGVYEMRVADNGPGIPASERERIFSKFARGPVTSQKGAGLGLAISRQIIERFEGELSLTPSSSGSGAEFVVRLKALGRE